MEKILFVTQAVTESSAYSTTRADRGDLEQVGTLRWVDDRCYRWVQNLHTSAMTIGMVACHDYGEVADALKSIILPQTTDLSFMAGIVASTTIAADSTGSAGDGGFGWIQVLGYHATASILRGETTAIAAGDYLIAVTDATYLDVEAAAAVTPDYTRNCQVAVAVATATTAAAYTGGVYINCV